MFRFDDIWLGLIARKANVEPFHCPEFHFYPKDKSRVSVLSHMIYRMLLYQTKICRCSITSLWWLLMVSLTPLVYSGFGKSKRRPAMLEWQQGK